METRPPLLIRVVLGVITIVSGLVPSRDRGAWRQEWHAEILHRWRELASRPSTLPEQMRLARRATGSIADAAWLRRQFTRDSEVVQDLRFGIRMAASRPIAFVSMAAILAVGIGSTAALLGLTDRLVVRALPYPDAGRLVSLFQRNVVTGEHEEVSPATVLDWRSRSSSFEGVAASEPFSVDLTGAGRPEVVYATRVTETFFDLLRVSPQAGRLFGATDYRPGSERVVVISDRFARRLGVQAGNLHQPIVLDGLPHVIIGILPPRADLNLFDGQDRRDVYLPKVYEESEKQLRGSGWWAAIARLKPGVSRDEAQAEMDVLSAQLAAEYPQQNRDYRAAVEPLETPLTRMVRPALVLMLTAAGLVLLIATANVANLQLLRAVERHHEFSLRTALGAGRGRLIRQMLTEAALLAFVASVLAVGVAWITIRACIVLAPIESARLTDLSVDGLMLVLTAAVGLATAFACGLVPALQFARRSRVAAAETPRASAGPLAARFRDLLVVSEVALAVVLAVVVGLLGRSFAEVLRVDPGFRGDRLAVVQVFAWDRRDTPQKLSAFFDDVFAEIRQIPGVTNVGAVSAMPFIDANINMESPLAIVGRPPAPAAEVPRTFVSIATPEYFRMMNIAVRSGRLPDANDRAATVPVAVISESLARKHWPNSDALGSEVTIRLRGRQRQIQVIGVVDAVRHDGLELPARDEVFLPLSQSPFGSMTLVVSSSSDPQTIVEPIKNAVWAVDPMQTIYDATTVDELLRASVAPRRFALELTAVFAGVAIGLAALGIYAVLTVATRQRTREFGVRLALGASPGAIRKAVLGHALKLGAAGLALGLAASVALAQALRAQLFSVTPADTITLLGVTVVAISMTLIAAYAPARRAIHVDPVRALRE